MSQTLFQSIQSQLATLGERRAWMLSGGRDWALGELKSLLLPRPQVDQTLLIAGEPVLGMQPGEVSTYLGSEFDVLIIDAWTHSRINDWLAAAGTLRAGGVLILLCPPLSHWPEHFALLNGADAKSLFIERFAQRISLREEGIALVQQCEGESLVANVAAYSGLLSDVNNPPAGSHGWHPVLPTASQVSTIQAIVKTATGRRWRPLVIRADRGRGKTAALGLAAAELLRSGFGNILITSVNVQAVSAAFQHAAASLGVAVSSSGGQPSLRFGGFELRYMTLTQLLDCREVCDLLLVDEAAMIAVSALETLILRYPRVVFATTVHGYEGSGRGFDIRFRKILDRERPQWRRQYLQDAVRWSATDPLEKALNSLFLLDAEPGLEVRESICAGDVAIRQLNVSELAADEQLLRQVFGLLVQAHYQTTPQDLVNLLDLPSQVFIAQRAGELCGVCLCVPEGDFAENLAAEVVAGRRRPHGHLAAQRLANISAEAEYLQCKSLRIVRIAVVEGARRQGVGRRLCEAAASFAENTDIAYLSSSFAADEDLVGFWTQAGFEPLYLGHRRDTSSGAYSLIVARGLNPTMRGRFVRQRQWFLTDLAESVAQSHPSISVALLMALLAELRLEDSSSALQQSSRDLLVASRYCRREITFEQSLASLRRLCKQGHYRGLSAWPLASAKLLLHQDWAQLAIESGLDGRQSVEEVLRNFFATLLDHAGGGTLSSGK